MIPMRYSTQTTSNPKLVERPPRKGESNIAWLKRTGITNGILLLGGSSVMHFRLRIAQSHVRSDLLPSYWSLAGILADRGTFDAVPLELRGDAADVPLRNGVQHCQLADYDDPRRFPNIGVISFTKQDA